MEIRINGEYFMKQITGKIEKNILTAVLVLFVFAAGSTLFAQNNRTTYRDASGRYQGSATVNGRTTIYRDASGRYQGSATVNGNRTIYRDASGRYQGSSTVNGRTTVYRDASGRYKGSSTK